MALRRLFGDRFSGYGSFGKIITTPDTIANHDMKDELPFIRPYLPVIRFDAEVIVAWALHFRWRYKFALITADLRTTQTYNAEIGKRRYGVCLLEQSNYVCGEEFISFDAQISSLYSTTYVLRPSGGEFDMPCDEPPDDTQITVVTNAMWFARSTDAGSFFPPYLATTNTPLIAEKVTFFPVQSVSGYIFGGSFEYQVVRTFNNDEYFNEFAQPPVINL